MSSSDLLRQAVDAARAGRRVDARTMLINLVEHDPHNEMAWIWLSGLVDDLDGRIIACENVLSINPANEKVRTYLAELQRQKENHEVGAQQEELRLNSFDQNPEDTTVAVSEAVKSGKKVDPLYIADQLETDGKYREALEIYEVQAAVTKDLKAFDRIYQRIAHIERLQDEKIRHVSPGLSITRLTFTWPLLYLSLALVQVGLNPFAHPAVYIWLGFPLVILGGFLLAISEIRFGNVILKKMLLKDRNETGSVQMVAAAVGWLLIVIPMVLIVLDSMRRLAIFQIPPRLFP